MAMAACCLALTISDGGAMEYSPARECEGQRHVAPRASLATQSTGAIFMAITAEDFYRSSNGDRWQLIRDTASGCTFVRHEPNLSSGGRRKAIRMPLRRLWMNINATSIT